MGKYEDLVAEFEWNLQDFMDRNKNVKKGHVGSQMEFYPEDGVNPFKLQRLLMEKGYSTSIYDNEEKIIVTIMKYLD